jgi:hypothetical protein
MYMTSILWSNLSESSRSAIPTSPSTPSWRSVPPHSGRQRPLPRLEKTTSSVSFSSVLSASPRCTIRPPRAPSAPLHQHVKQSSSSASWEGVVSLKSASIVVRPTPSASLEKPRFVSTSSHSLFVSAYRHRTSDMSSAMDVKSAPPSSFFMSFSRFWRLLRSVALRSARASSSWSARRKPLTSTLRSKPSRPRKARTAAQLPRPRCLSFAESRSSSSSRWKDDV